MSAAIVVPVLCAAIMHAGWNAIAKRISDRLVSSALIGVVYAVIGLAGVILLPRPNLDSLWAVGLSALLQVLYLPLLTSAYKFGEFGQVYPLARGLAPLTVCLFSTLVLGEDLSAVQLLGVLTVSAALLSMVLIGRGHIDRRAIWFAVATGLTIAGYTCVDGVGVRLSGQPLAYACWGFALQGLILPWVCLALARDKRAFYRESVANIGPGVICGVLSLVAYAIVVWAQSVAPLALVSALRETSVVFAGLVGWIVLKERMPKARVALTVIAVVGIIAIEI